MSQANKQKRQLTPEERRIIRKNKKINNMIILFVVILSIVTTIFFVGNMGYIGIKKSSSSAGNTLSVDSASSMKNDLYKIGNNPTSVQKEYFEELTKAIKADDDLAIAQSVVKSFIADFFTWTNKDGNYEVGGVQYLYGPKFTTFQEEQRWGFYSDLDLYITQYGRENLLEVSSVETPVVDYAADYSVGGEVYKAFYVEANWEYKSSSKIDVSEFQSKGYFTVIDNDGRFEIVSIYDNWD